MDDHAMRREGGARPAAGDIRYRSGRRCRRELDYATIGFLFFLFPYSQFSSLCE